MKRNVLILLLLSLVGGLTLVAIGRKRAARPQELVAIPAFKSGVEGVEVSSMGVSADSTGAATLQVLIVNHTPKVGIGVLLTSGGAGQELGGTREGPALPAFGTCTMTFNAANLQPDKPLALSAVVWEDGTSSGYPVWADIYKKKVSERLSKDAAQ